MTKTIKPKNVLDNKYIFPACAVVVMNETRWWDNAKKGAMLVIDNITYYITIGYSGNANYFKSDGQSYCTSLFVMHDGKCYLESCGCSWSAKEAKKDFDEYVEKITKNPFTVEEFNQKFEKSYSRHSAITNEDKTAILRKDIKVA